MRIPFVERKLGYWCVCTESPSWLLGTCPRLASSPESPSTSGLCVLQGPHPHLPLPSWQLSEASLQSIVGKTGPSHPSSSAELKKGASGRGAQYAGPQACTPPHLTFLSFPPTITLLAQLLVSLSHCLLWAVCSSCRCALLLLGSHSRPLPAAHSLALLSAFFSQARCQGLKTVSSPWNVLASFRNRREREFLGQIKRVNGLLYKDRVIK